jgi:hypothetical protein
MAVWLRRGMWKRKRKPAKQTEPVILVVDISSLGRRSLPIFGTPHTQP